MSDTRPLYRSRVVRGRGRRHRGRAGGGVGGPAPRWWRAPARIDRRDRGRGAHRPRRTASSTTSRSTTVGVSTSSSAVQGPPVVLLHGFMLSGALWAHQLRDLAAASPGHRPRPARPRRPRSRDVEGSPWTEDAGLVDELRAEARMPRWRNRDRRHAPHGAWTCAPCSTPSTWSTPWWSGHSMGGMVALQLAHDLPAAELRRRVAGHGARVHHRRALHPPARVRGRGPPGRAGLGARPGAGRPVGRAHRWRRRTCAGGSPAWGSGPTPRRPRCASSRGSTWRRRPPPWPSCCPAIALFDLSKWLGTLELPVLVVVGSHDRLTPPAPRPAHRRRRCLIRSWWNCPAAGTCP